MRCGKSFAGRSAIYLKPFPLGFSLKSGGKIAALQKKIRCGA
jgi:hypothetical protein